MFAGLAEYFFLIKLDYVIVYFYFYLIVKKIVSEKNMLLNFRKSIGLLTCMNFFFFYKFIFVQFHPLILDWLRIEFHNLFCFVFYEVVVFLKSFSIDLTLGFAIVYFCYHIVK